MRKATISTTRHGLLAAALLLVPLLASPARAQITINRADIQAVIGQSFQVTTYEDTTFTAASLQTVLNATGPNQQYNLSGLNFFATDVGTVSYTSDPAGIPGINDPAFQGANFIARYHLRDSSGAFATDSSVWAIGRLQADALFGLGAVIAAGDLDDNGTADTLRLRFNPPIRYYPLPLTAGVSWRDSTTQTISFGGFDFAFQLVESSTVEGWGTLVTPSGSAPVLRIRNVTRTTVFGQTSTSTSIQFLSADQRLSASIELEEDGTPVHVSYTTQTRGPGTAVERGTLPEAFTLYQNYPNPFNPVTLIPYELQRPGHVRLRVTDLLGREVAVLVDGMQEAGYHTVSFDARDLPSGQYLYHIESGSTSQARLMTVVK